MNSLPENHEIVKLATQYIEHGLSVIPIPYKEKGSAIKWEEYQKRQATEPEIQQWFNNSHQSNIAIVCGSISKNLVVLDCDSEEKFWEMSVVICNKRNIDNIFEWTPIVKTGKGYHIYLRTLQSVKSKKFPALDIKGEGGYVIAPPSIHPSGAIYAFTEDTLFPIREIDNLKDIGVDIDAQPLTQAPSNVPEGHKIPKGQQNYWLFRRASSYRRQGDTEELIFQKLKIDVLRCDQDLANPFTDKDLERIAKSSSKYLPVNNGYIGLTDSNSPFSDAVVSERYKSVTQSVTKPDNAVKSVTKPLAERIEEWVKDTSSWFSYDDLDKDLSIGSAEKGNRRICIKRLRDAKILETHPSNNKLLRFINEETITVNYKLSHTVHPLDIKFPLKIEEYFNFYSKNIVVVAGSPDAGKTAWLLNFIRLNQQKWQIFYQSSEMGQDELAVRLKKFAGIDLDDWTFVAEERSSNFHDVIRPDDINIIDYMELTSEPYMVAEYLRKIHDRLNNGVAIVALQKKRGAELGRGAEFSLEKPRLYLGMDSGKMTIQKCKNWATEENPNKLVTNFKIVAGCEFHITDSWHKVDEE